MSHGQKSAFEQLDRLPIEPIHWQSTPNAPIVLGSTPAYFSNKSSKSVEIPIEASLRFVPKLRTQFTVPPSPEESPIQRFARILGQSHPDHDRLYLSDYGTAHEVFCISDSGAGSVFVPTREPIQVCKSSESISKAIFHLINWPDFRGPQNFVLLSGTPPHQSAKSCGKFTLDFDGWAVTIAASSLTGSAIKALKETGGYSITHVGMIQRVDQSSFSTKRLEEVLILLSQFFSLVLGRWSSPCLTVGTDSSGERVYEEWGTRKCDDGHWSGAHSFFDAHHSEMLSGLLPGFCSLWSSEVWHRPLKEAIYWYVKANQGGSGLGVDSALLFTQAALELLAWTYCVLDRKMISKKAFDVRGLSAADKLRLLASGLGIPLQIPQSLTALHARRGQKWADSMDALTDLRNCLVHPGLEREIPRNAYYHAWQLSMWYLDLVLLRLCKYNGHYANRLSERVAGQVEPVPWNS